MYVAKLEQLLVLRRIMQILCLDHVIRVSFCYIRKHSRRELLHEEHCWRSEQPLKDLKIQCDRPRTEWTRAVENILAFMQHRKALMTEQLGVASLTRIYSAESTTRRKNLFVCIRRSFMYALFILILSTGRIVR